MAVSVRQLEEARVFYRDILGFKEGRSSKNWVDFNFYGHQFVIHQVVSDREKAAQNAVDGHEVPVPHFGVVLEWDQWERLSEKLKSYNIRFVIEPHIRFRGQVGEQATMFFCDPSGNALEFKAFKDDAQVFARQN